MTLLERAQKNLAQDLGDVNLQSAKISEIINNTATIDDLSFLHDSVKKIIPPDKLADYVSKNIDMAKAEVKRAVNYAFNDKY